MKTVTIPEWAARLAMQFLSEYSDRLSNDGCNDFTVPDFVPKDKLITAIQEANACSEADAKPLCGYNWAVVSAVETVIKSNLRDNV